MSPAASTPCPAHPSRHRRAAGQRRTGRNPASLFAAGLALVTIALLAACTGRQTAVTPAAGAAVDGDRVLPVRRVVLFRSGVAYMERRGRFSGRELVLRVRPTQIRDILKSITVVDFSGGSASSLALPVDVGSERALAELPKLELGQGSLAGLIGALRGAEVVLQVGGEEQRGRLVGMDTLGPDTAGRKVSILDEQGTLRVLPLSELRGLSIVDPSLAQGLIKGLDISLGQEAWRSVELRLFLDEQAAERDLLVSYVVEMPSWKSSYRLVLDDKEEPLLQGWAVVDNVSGADWRDVRLTLTTGSPVSFHYDLYTPRFVQRPDLTPYRALGLPPPIARSSQVSATSTLADASGAASAPSEPMAETASRYGGEREASRRDRSADRRARRSGAGSQLSALLGGDDFDDSLLDGVMTGEGGAAELALGALMSRSVSTGGHGLSVLEKKQGPAMDAAALAASVQAQSRVDRVGSLYRFELPRPLTVPNRSSTMVALINTRLPGQAVYAYHPDSGVPAARRHPFRAVSVQNAAGSVLEPGPISIIRGGQFVGEGLIERIEKGQRTYISYALDSAVNVTHAAKADQQVAGLVSVTRGLIKTRSYSIRSHTYEVQASADDGEKVPLVVSLPKQPGWEVEIEGGRLESETADRRFFATDVVPGEKVTLVVREKLPQFTQHRILDQQAQQALLLQVTAKDLEPEVLAKLQPLADAARKLAAVRERMNHLQGKRGELATRANEIRSNLELLRRTRNVRLKAEQQRRLQIVDRQLSKLTDELVGLRDRAAELRVELTSLVEGLELEL